MRRFDIEDTHSLPDNLSTLIQEYFGSLSEIDSSEYDYYIAEPAHSVLEKVAINIDVENDAVLLHFEEITPQKAKKQEIFDEVPQAIQAKNDFLYDVTGKTVEQRKTEWRNDVLPVEEEVIRYPDSS